MNIKQLRDLTVIDFDESRYLGIDIKKPPRIMYAFLQACLLLVMMS